MNSFMTRGAYLALGTALVSGVSVYINSFGVKEFSDPFVYTTAKNLIVALALGALILLPGAWPELRRLSSRQWSALVGLGIFGGSIPFLLFFYGLQQATAPGAALIHKTLFIWVAILAVTFLRERLGRLQLVALAVLFLGNVVLLGRPDRWDIGRPELIILAATLLWAVEAVVARRVMGGVSARVAALGRMGFGSIAMIGFLAFTGRMPVLLEMSGTQFGWVLITSVFLTAYVAGYYGALKHAPATLVSSVLVVGSVVTSLLHAVFSARTYSVEQVAGFVLIVLAAAIWIYVARGWGVSMPTLARKEAPVGR